MRILTQKITEIAICRGWIPEEQHEWCSYTIMKYLETIIFFCFISLISCLFGRWLEMFFFVAASYILRRRIGGWHARSPLRCQVLSIGISCMAVLLLGLLISECVPLSVEYIMALVSSVMLLCARPVYPAQLHFSDEIKVQNGKRKNRIVLIIILIESISYIVLPRVLPSLLMSSWGVLIGTMMETEHTGGGGGRMNKMEGICRNILRKAVDSERTVLIPACIGLLYQPERPVEQAATSLKTSTHEEDA
ncbi:MAG: accessory gene regulator B family protein [Clostridiales bacterium]|nr:accessory gene regulator B family protein [Clostridiales bacterium]